MGTVEDAIFAAWECVRHRLAAEPLELARRLQRRRVYLTRPPRAWCLTLRSCDRRIACADARSQREHCVRVSAEMLRQLCAPVQLGPRVPLNVVAEKLGCLPEALRYARIKGTFQADYVPPVM